MPETTKPVIVVGGGGAGILAAWRAASLGAKVLLIERNKRLGIKLLISGGGKCNITHAGEVDDLARAFLPGEGHFLRPAFYRFHNGDILALLEGAGVATYTRPNGRVFPSSGRAGDVVAALAGHLRSLGVEICLNTRVESLTAATGVIRSVHTSRGEYPAASVVLATGGCSYPKTGTTGDGINWARALGHKIVPIRPALAPIAVQPPLPPDWRGVAVREGRLRVSSAGKVLHHWDDDILFTHEGLSGPAVLEVSRVAAEAMSLGPVHLSFDFFPNREFDELDKELNAHILQHRGRMIGSILERWLPNRMIPTLLQTIDVHHAKKGYVLLREERRKIIHLLKGWEIGEVSRIPMERGEVSAGGVALEEVDPHTMQSRRVSGLYLCGEMLDIAGPIGGYNLQAAFSTGFVAGETAGREWTRKFGAPTGTQARKPEVAAAKPPARLT